MTQEKNPSPNLIRARQTRSDFKDHGRLKSPKLREKVARNLGHIIETRKSQLNLSKLVVDAGLSTNSDPNRLGRFRILPNRKVSNSTINRLSQDPLAYLRILEAVSSATEESADGLILEMLMGTIFEEAEIRGLSIEPFEQLFELIQKKIDVLDSKYNLSAYFDAISRHEILPRWETGPFCSGRRTSHHAYERSKLIGWDIVEKDEFNGWRYEAMPCVPLCRIRDTDVGELGATITIDGTKRKHTIGVFNRLYLAIGKFTHRVYDKDNSSVHGRVVADEKPQPYLFGTSEFRGEIYFEVRNELSIEPISGSVFEYEAPAFLYDTERGIEIEKIGDRFLYFDPGEDGRTIGGPGLGQNHREFGCWEPGILRRIGKLDVPTIRQVFGRERETYDTVASHDDVLDLKRRRITIAPQNTIASFMEANLLSHPHQDEALVRNQGENFLDALESDTKRMVTNFWTWLKKSEEKLHQEHNLLLEELEGQLASSGTKE